MLVVETIAKIRRAYFVQRKTIKAICRELKVSRKVVRKVLRSGETAFEYVRTVQPQPKVGPWLEELDRLLATNAARPSRERLTLTRVFEELRGLGYEGGYDAVRRYAASWRRRESVATAAAFVPLSFAPGEAYQFDWSHEVVLIGGVTVVVKVAHVRLCHSRMLFARAYPRESQEMVFDAHDRAFAFFKAKLLTERPAALDAPAWRTAKNSRRFTLAITEAGRQAIGVEALEAETPQAAETPKQPRRRARAAKAAAAEAPTASEAVRSASKQAQVIALLRRPEGATVEALMEATGWQRHTVRGAISGALKKKLGLAVAAEKVEGRGRVYRIAAA